MIEFDEHTTKSEGLDLTAMLDVVFLLLIFFLLTSIFSKPSLPLALPEAETARTERAHEVSVAIQRDGSILLNGQETSSVELFPALAALYGNRAEKNISLVSDKGVPFGKVVEVMDVAKKAGVENIAVIAERKK